VIALPPFEAGAVHATLIVLAFGVVSVGVPGAPGVLGVVTGVELLEAVLLPTALVAVTRQL
jgi:hypothetical protein